MFFRDPEEFYEPHNFYYGYTEEKTNIRPFKPQLRYPDSQSQPQPNHSRNPFRDANTNKLKITPSAMNLHFDHFEVDNSDFDNGNENKYYYDEKDNDNTGRKCSNYPFKNGYLLSKNVSNRQTNRDEIFDSPGKYSDCKDSGSTICVSSFDSNFKYPLIKKDKYHATIKISDEGSGSGSTIGSRKLLTARKQLIVAAYFRSFKTIALITFLLFFCPFISTMLDLSCVSKNTFCLPKFEIQSSGPLESGSNEMSLFSSLTMQPIHRDPTSNVENSLSLIEKFMNGLSGFVLDSAFNPVLIKSKISETFKSDHSIIFKFSNFGYCKEMIDNFTVQKSCHPYFGYGIDVPSVFIKDLAYSLSQEEIEGDPEYVSDIFAENYRGLFNFLKLKEYHKNKFLLYGFLSSILSISNSYMTIIAFLMDLGSLITCVVITMIFKSKANQSLSACKNYLFESNAKRHLSEQQHQFGQIRGFLIGITIVIWISTILRILGVTYELIYILQIENVLRSLNLRLIEGIKLVSSGAVLDILNVLIHLCVSISLTACVICKPWIVKITI